LAARTMRLPGSKSFLVCEREVLLNMNILRIQTVMALAVMAGMAVPVYAAEEAAADAAAAESPSGNADHGREIFTTICSQCHNMTHETSAVGAPGLRGVLKRHSAEWIDKWIHDPEALYKSGDKAAQKLVNGNSVGLTMPTLPVTQDPQNRRDIIEFLKTLTD